MISSLRIRSLFSFCLLVALTGCGDETGNINAGVDTQVGGSRLWESCLGRDPKAVAGPLFDGARYDVGARVTVRFLYFGPGCVTVPKGSAACPTFSSPEVKSIDPAVWAIEAQGSDRIVLVARAPGVGGVIITDHRAAAPAVVRLVVAKATALRLSWISPSKTVWDPRNGYSLPKVRGLDQLAGVVSGGWLGLLVDRVDSTGAVVCAEPAQTVTARNATLTETDVSGYHEVDVQVADTFTGQGFLSGSATVTATSGELATTVTVPILPPSAVTDVTAEPGDGNALQLGAWSSGLEVASAFFHVESLSPELVLYPGADRDAKTSAGDTSSPLLAYGAASGTGPASGQIRVSALGSPAAPVVVSVSSL